jgi:hypothetical protein
MKYFSFLVTLILILSCSSYKKNLVSDGTQNQAITNAIIDFSNNSRLYRKHDVFRVKLIDTLYRKVLEKTDGQNYRCVNSEPYENIIVIRIGPVTNKFTYYNSDSLKNRYNNLPSQYLEMNGNLFVWDDKTIEISEKILEIMTKYKVLEGVDSFPEFVIDDSQKAVHYYICRNNYSKFKSITTNIGIGYYDAPKVQCN